MIGLNDGGVVWQFSRLALKLAYDPLLWVVLVIQLHRKDRDLWQQVLCFTLLVIGLNACLKHAFALPLSPPMVGYALPSGHTQKVCAFWGYAGYLYFKRTGDMRYLIGAAVIVVLVAWALVFNHYHSVLDVSAGVVATLIEGMLFGAMQQRWQHVAFAQQHGWSFIWCVALFLSVFWGLYPSTRVVQFSLSGLLGMGLATVLPPHDLKKPSWLMMPIAAGLWPLWHVGVYGQTETSIWAMMGTALLFLWLLKGGDGLWLCWQKARRWWV